MGHERIMLDSTRMLVAVALADAVQVAVSDPDRLAFYRPFAPGKRGLVVSGFRDETDHRALFRTFHVGRGRAGFQNLGAVA